MEFFRTKLCWDQRKIFIKLGFCSARNRIRLEKLIVYLILPLDPVLKHEYSPQPSSAAFSNSSTEWSLLVFSKIICEFFISAMHTSTTCSTHFIFKLLTHCFPAFLSFHFRFRYFPQSPIL